MINIEVVVAQEADENDIELPGDLKGKAGGRSDRGYHGHSAHERLLQQLEAGTPGKHEKRLAQGRTVGEKLGAEELIHGIVPSDIFVQSQETSCRIK